MSINDIPAASREFVASSQSLASRMTGKRTAIVVYGLGLGVGLGMGVGLGSALGLGVGMAIFLVTPLAWTAYMWWRSRQKVLIGVTSQGITVSQRPGDVFALSDAKLGPWVTMGVALHLQCGSHRLVLGARERRIPPTTSFDAPPVRAVDAWLWGSEFDELLAMSGRPHGLEVRGPALGEPTRCLIYPNPQLGEEFGPFAFRKHLGLMRSQSQPSVVLDVDIDEIRAIDPNSDTLLASASLEDTTVTPVTYRPLSVTSGDGSTYDYPATPGLVVHVPGLQPLIIGCLDLVQSHLRFSWRGNVPVENARAANLASGADWLTLAEKFGLAPQLKDKAVNPPHLH